MSRNVGFSAALVLLLPCTANAGARLPEIFTNHMVLQQEPPIAVWEWAEPGAEVAVSLAGRSTSAKARGDRRWRVSLPPMKADGTPHTLSVKGRNSIALEDMAVGEVWLPSKRS